MPIVPGSIRELSRSRLLQRSPELHVANRPAQRLNVLKGSQIHHLRDDSMAIVRCGLRRLPPDVFASVIQQIHTLDFRPKESYRKAH